MGSLPLSQLGSTLGGCRPLSKEPLVSSLCLSRLPPVPNGLSNAPHACAIPRRCQCSPPALEKSI